jgi:hypothetical protein
MSAKQKSNTGFKKHLIARLYNRTVIVDNKLMIPLNEMTF